MGGGGERAADRQTDRQTDRQREHNRKGSETHRDRDVERDRERDRARERERDRKGSAQKVEGLTESLSKAQLCLTLKHEICISPTNHRLKKRKGNLLTTDK